VESQGARSDQRHLAAELEVDGNSAHSRRVVSLDLPFRCDSIPAQNPRRVIEIEAAVDAHKNA